jgi:hypothetical protein
MTLPFYASNKGIKYSSLVNSFWNSYFTTADEKFEKTDIDSYAFFVFSYAFLKNLNCFSSSVFLSGDYVAIFLHY